MGDRSLGVWDGINYRVFIECCYKSRAGGAGGECVANIEVIDIKGWNLRVGTGF